MDCLRQVVLHGHGEHKVSVLASSAFRRHGCRIPAYKSMNLDTRLSHRLSDNIGYTASILFSFPALLSFSLGVIDGMFFPWDNLSNMFKC